MTTWVLETNVFSSDEAFIAAVKKAGDKIVYWQDEWWNNNKFPSLSGHIIFRGSLDNANKIRKVLPWSPGAYCATELFHCSVWYDLAKQWILNNNYILSTVANAKKDSECFGSEVFVRPDSPLKPFSGRILNTNNVSPQTLDCGFYYDDVNTKIILASVKKIDLEIRCVIVNKQVIASSAYNANHLGIAMNVPNEYLEYATKVANLIDLSEDVYIMDICNSNGDLYVVELNPFSGADLYNCDVNSIVNIIGCKNN